MSEVAAPDGNPTEPPRPNGAARTRRTVVAIAVGAVVLLLVGLLIGINRGAGDDGTDADVLTDSRLEPGLEMPDVVLTDTDGEPFPLLDRAAGRLTLLYLGYVNCPDVCPITTAVIDRTLETAPPEVRDTVQVVFVSVDPDRDTPQAIRRYLDGFDRSFVGVTATPADLEALQAALEAPLATSEPPDDEGDYLVGHASAVYAIDADGIARHRFPFGTRQSDWESVLPPLVAGATAG